MMSERVDPFARLINPPAFELRPKQRRAPESGVIEQISEEENFPSRQAKRVTKSAKRQPRLYRTGRDQPVSIKMTKEIKDRFYKLADERNASLGRLFELAIEALEQSSPKSP